MKKYIIEFSLSGAYSNMYLVTLRHSNMMAIKSEYMSFTDAKNSGLRIALSEYFQTWRIEYTAKKLRAIIHQWVGVDSIKHALDIIAQNEYNRKG